MDTVGFCYWCRYAHSGYLECDARQHRFAMQRETARKARFVVLVRPPVETPVEWEDIEF